MASQPTKQESTCSCPPGCCQGDRWFKPAAIIIGILIVIGLFGNIYLLLKKQTIVRVAPALSPQTIATPTLDQTDSRTNWKIYTNDLMKYSISYPPYWSVKGVGADEGVNIALLDENNNQVLFLISGENIDKLNLVNSYKAKSCFEMSCDPFIEQNENIIDKSVIKLGELSTLFVTTEINNENKKYYFFKGNNIISVFQILTSDKEQLLIIDQILSTFKFLN